MLFAGATSLPVLFDCIRLCHLAQTTPVVFSAELAAIALVLLFAFAVAAFFLIAGIFWLATGRCRVRVRSTWVTLILGVGHGLLFVGGEWEVFPPFFLVIGLLVMVPILFSRCRDQSYFTAPAQTDSVA